MTIGGGNTVDVKCCVGSGILLLLYEEVGTVSNGGVKLDFILSSLLTSSLPLPAFQASTSIASAAVVLTG